MKDVSIKFNVVDLLLSNSKNQCDFSTEKRCSLSQDKVNENAMYTI